MKDKKNQKTEDIVNILEERLHYVERFANGQIKVNGWDFWCTTEKFWNGKLGVKGQGLRNFIKALEDN